MQQLSCAASEAASLFSGQVYLPLFSALDGVMDKFVSNDLARYVASIPLTFIRLPFIYRKYPLIFGPWREVRGQCASVALSQLVVCTEARRGGTLVPFYLMLAPEHCQVFE